MKTVREIRCVENKKCGYLFKKSSFGQRDYLLTIADRSDYEGPRPGD